MDAQKRLRDIANDLKEGADVPSFTVREFLSWFDAKRRGSFIVWIIRRALDEAGLITEPDFESLYIDATFLFKSKVELPLYGGGTLAVTLQDVTLVAEGKVSDTPSFGDPTYRLSKLEAANRVPVSVSPNAAIVQAVTLLASNDFSQLPVMVGDRDVKGVISWASLGARFGMGQAPSEVRYAMDLHQEISADASLFQAIPIIVQHQYVLVRGRDQRIVGIVTASDLSLQFQQLTEPFLLLGEIENHIRRLIDQKFSQGELADIRDVSDTSRPIESVSDLTFGEYLRLIEEPSRWLRLGMQVDRKVFCEQLERVRTIRNDVMHFDPDGIPPEDLDHLRRVVQFLRRLDEIRLSECKSRSG